MVVHDLPESPYLKANCLSRLFFWWLTPLFRDGCSRDLNITDLHQAIPTDKSAQLGKLLDAEWTKELKKCQERDQTPAETEQLNEKNSCQKRPNLLRAISKVFCKRFMLVGIFAFIEECIVRIVQPLALGYLIRYFSNPGDYETYVGWILALAIPFMLLFNLQCHHLYFFGVTHIGMQVRVACCALVYRKATKLSQQSLQKTAIGQMVNLLSNDVNRFDTSTIFIHYLWIGPIQTLIVTAILWNYFGYSCIIGLVILILYVPFQGLVGKRFSKLRTATAIRTDKRIRIMNEITSGIRVIKMYAWEKPFSSLVEDARRDEVGYIRKTSTLRSLNMTLFLTSSKIIVFLTLLVFVWTGNGLTAELVFVTLALYNNVRLVMTLFFPSAISQLAEARVSVRRLEDFLLMEEREVTKQDEFGPHESTNIGLTVKDVAAKWNDDAEENTIENISLNVEGGSIIAITGHVGSGKGSVLHAILRELPVSKGTIEVRGKVAYASQEPWLFAGSVKENILFGKPYDKAWYEEVIASCALQEDLKQLPYGDNTLVGERGNLLSGGQKARVTLARSAYSNADVYLLDDPLSAVDARVGQHLFCKCMGREGLLSKKARILVTHQLQFLKFVDYVIILDHGRIQAEGTYEELVARGINFDQIEQKVTSAVSSSHSTPLHVTQPNVRSRSASLCSKLSQFSSGSRNQIYPSPTAKKYILGDQGPIAGHTYIPNGFEADDMEEIPLDSTPKKTTDPEKVPDEKFQVEEEEKQTKGTVPAGLYFKYFRAGSGSSILVLFLTNIICQIFFTGSDYWLAVWTTAEEFQAKNITAVPVHTSRSEPLYLFYHDRDFQIYGYMIVIILVLLTSWVRTILFFHLCIRSSIKLHKKMFDGIIRAPILFFETNAAGRILNRFSKDMGQIDDALPPTFFDAIAIFLNILGILVIIACVNHILLVPALVLFVIFYFLRRVYMLTARSLKRLEGIARSPVFSHLATSLYGITTIRAFKAEENLIHQFHQHQDLHTATWFLFLASTRWFGIWLDWISVCFIGVVTMSFMISSSSGADVGLAVSSAMMLTGMLQWGVRQAAEVENQMVSVERVMEYSDLKPEAALVSTKDKEPPKDWPKKGQLIFRNVFLKYGDHTVLTDVTFLAKPSEKVGIVGRTGAGKSSLISVLFRIAEPTGSIIIDDVDITQIGLHDLRSKISIIPQEPIVFEGTVRKNLDPFEKYSDKAIWDALEECHLAHYVREFPLGLEAPVAEGGGNFSIGQRQLICLGRALLQQNRILVLDEATANIDNETDALIQKVIQTKFKDCTVLSVAHRLHTVMDSDKMLVLDAGRVMEFDEPYTLVQDERGLLRGLVNETGRGTAEKLLNQAQMAQERRQENQQPV